MLFHTDTLTPRGLSGFLARARDERGFTMIEMIIVTVILAVISAPVAGILLASAAQSKSSRERTGADQLIQAKLETIRSMSYSQVGLVGGNPDGTLVASVNATLPTGQQVVITTQAAYVTDAIPGAYATHADYKKVTVTIARQSDGVQVAKNSTYIASASAPPLQGTDWVQITRQVTAVGTGLPITGATVRLTGGPNAEDRTDTTDGAGNVLFPALDSSTTIPPPNYILATTKAGYSVFPDDLPLMVPEQIGASPGANSTAAIRMYLNGISLTVNVQNNAGAPYTGGATVSLQSSRCGLTTVTIPSGQSSTTITTCNSSRTQMALPLVPNVSGQTVPFATYGATAWATTGGASWGSVTSQFVVPSNYPTVLSQTVTVKFGSTTYTTAQVKVTVTKAGVPDKNARVSITGGAANVYLYGVTDTLGTVTLTVPVTSTATTYTVNANEQGGASTPTTAPTFSISSASTPSPFPVAVTVS